MDDSKPLERTSKIVANILIPPLGHQPKAPLRPSALRERLPPLGSVLYCLDIQQGFEDTLFCSMRRAYQSLSHGLQALVEKMTAQHSAVRMVELNNRHKFNVKMEAIPDPATHPVMRTNISDIPSLYVNLIYTVGSSGITPTESEPLPEFSVYPGYPTSKYL